MSKYRILHNPKANHYTVQIEETVVDMGGSYPEWKTLAGNFQSIEEAEGGITRHHKEIIKTLPVVVKTIEI